MDCAPFLLRAELSGKKQPDSKSDVYSFGVLLLEMLSGKEPSDPLFDDSEEGPFVAWARIHIEQDAPSTFLDSCLLRSSEDNELMMQAAQLALRCTNVDPYTRPSMLEVVDILSASD